MQTHRSCAQHGQGLSLCAPHGQSCRWRGCEGAPASACRLHMPQPQQVVMEGSAWSRACMEPCQACTPPWRSSSMQQMGVMHVRTHVENAWTQTRQGKACARRAQPEQPPGHACMCGPLKPPPHAPSGAIARRTCALERPRAGGRPDQRQRRFAAVRVLAVASPGPGPGPEHRCPRPS